MATSARSATSPIQPSIQVMTLADPASPMTASPTKNTTLATSSSFNV